MSRRAFRSLALICSFSLFACTDDGKAENSESASGTAESGETTSNNSEESASNGMEMGDGDGDPGDGDGDTGDGDGDTGDGDGDTGDGDGDTGDGDGDTGDGDGDTGDGDGDGDICGDGVLNMGEECDDGVDNGDNGACLSDCILNVCGDSFEGPDEGCDDGNLMDGDGCSAMCTIENPDPEVIFCGNKIYECGDTIDNDMDGLIDLDDPECTTPCDDDESSFLTELPGQNNDCKADCYWDGDSGGGNDNCEWNLKCDPENPGAGTMCEYDPNFMMCEVMQPQMCLEVCEPLVPNGCDCFGCCLIEDQFVYLGNGNCSLDTLDECQGCTQQMDCVNPCEPELCELCFGQDIEDLPPECDEASCPDGITPCVDINDCPQGEFCQTGCCTPIQ